MQGLTLTVHLRLPCISCLVDFLYVFHWEKITQQGLKGRRRGYILIKLRQVLLLIQQYNSIYSEITWT
jgi:hypothetical protein